MIIYIALVKHLLDSTPEMESETDQVIPVALEAISAPETELSEEAHHISLTSSFNRSISNIFRNLFSLEETGECSQYEVNIGASLPGKMKV